MWRTPPPKNGGSGTYIAQPFARPWRCRRPSAAVRRITDGVIARTLRRLRESEALRPSGA